MIRGKGARKRRNRCKRLAHRDGKKCKICGKPFKNYDNITIDHIIPRSKGGTNDLSNCQLACAKCNRRKGNRLPMTADVKTEILELPPQYEAFVAAYVTSFNATEAAKSAGYAESGAHVQGCRLLKDVNIARAVGREVKERIERLGINQDMLVLNAWQVYERCMQGVQVMEYDPTNNCMQPTGEWQFDSKGALGALTTIAKLLGLLDKKRLPDDVQQMIINIRLGHHAEADQTGKIIEHEPALKPLAALNGNGALHD